MNGLGSWPTMGSVGEMIFFCCVAVVMVCGALGVLFFKKAAYAAISMVVVMIGLAMLYFALQAPFLGIVQVVVYTGAIMMLFLFVIMMIGLGASDDYSIQRRGNIVAAVLGGLGFTLLIFIVISHTTMNGPGEIAVDPYSNEPITGLAATLFSKHWLAIEIADALLITAAVGAMYLTHTDRLAPKLSQLGVAKAKMRAFAESGGRIGQLPSPGVYAKSNAADVPAISGETLEPLEESVPRVIRVRGLERTLGQVDPEVAQSLMLARAEETIDSPFSHEASAAVPLSGAWGMPGPGAPTGLDQPMAPSFDVTDVAEVEAASNQEEEK
ncbi:NADH-quinone oxidoreductase subunit J [Schaalia vaccimaxillae]|uniref:NADH-quinone oxidoreductase subunit J n=1 Tax=Schaalia vaccimaxillae TaxID=183916 RepID=UPI0003B4527C|nr:NADH-quinone oxidoreductase subunit J [Schaalia vaccimaxillae]